ncbi:hypothetical protein IKE72_02330 [Candidatus Saccharibacteria bacterium]|nr:hypothetical protein [Candidatus Saccharibacteria bacterium]
MKTKGILLRLCKKALALVIILGLACIFGSHARATQAEEIKWSPPDFYFRAINPGYKEEGISNVGEMIEIARKESDTMISLAGLKLGYTNSSGNYTIIFEFPEKGYMVGETILLKLAGSPGAELASLEYTKTLAMSGGLTLLRGDDVLDTVCWTGKEGCLKAFNSASPTTLVRDVTTGEWVHLPDYTPTASPESYYEEPDEAEGKGAATASHCNGIQFSEILSFYESAKTEQFIELYNPTSEQIPLDGCNIKYKNKNYALTGIVKPEEYFVYLPSGFNLTKNPTNANTIEIAEADDTVVDKMEYKNGQRKGASFAQIGYDEKGEEIWRVTYAPTPGSPNNFQEYKTCEEGKVINPDTGNCVKATEVVTKTCKDGYYLNIFTGRCNKIPDTSTKTCKEGYYLNPETNRCKKIQDNDGANYSLTEEKYNENSSFVGLIAVISVVILGLAYLAYEFRDKIKKLFSKLFHRK